MKKEIEVEGFTVLIEPIDGGGFIVSIPTLSGCAVQVKKESEARVAIIRQMNLIMPELAAQKRTSKSEPVERPSQAKLKR